MPDLSCKYTAVLAELLYFCGMKTAADKTAFPIDAVITWVDGADPEHRQKRDHYRKLAGIPTVAVPTTQYNQIGELAFVLRSIIQFAPFVRHIYIVTDAQIPPIIATLNAENPVNRSRIMVVDHQEIFANFPKVLPTFNSLTIESVLQHIKGLAEHFIYFNDDMFLIKPTKSTDWFEGSKPVLRGVWYRQPQGVWYKRLKAFFFPKSLQRPSFRRAQAQAAQLVGYSTHYFRGYHSPRPLLKSQLISYFDDHKELLNNQIAHRFRHPSQFTPYTLFNHWMIRQNAAVLKDARALVEIHNPQRKSLSKIKKLLEKASANPSVFMLNLQSLDLVDSSKLAYITQWLTTHITQQSFPSHDA